MAQSLLPAPRPCYRTLRYHPLVHLNQRTGRAICWLLVLLDLVLGVGTVLFPLRYFSLFHPELPASEAPVDLIVRTGILWLMFCAIQLCGALSRAPAKWFFAIALIRLIEVPADLAYGIAAQGATTLSRAMILSAPPFNAVVGILLLTISRRLSRTPSPQSARQET